MAEEDENIIQKLMGDVTGGGLSKRRRKAANSAKGFDLIDSDDEELLLRNHRRNELGLGLWEDDNDGREVSNQLEGLQKYGASFKQVLKLPNTNLIKICSQKSCHRSVCQDI